MGSESVAGDTPRLRVMGQPHGHRYRLHHGFELGGARLQGHLGLAPHRDVPKDHLDGPSTVDQDHGGRGLGREG